MSEDKAIPTKAPAAPVTAPAGQKVEAAKVVPETAPKVEPKPAKAEETPQVASVETRNMPRRGETKELSKNDRIPSSWNMAVLDGDRIAARSVDNNYFEGTRKEFSKFIGS